MDNISTSLLLSRRYEQLLHSEKHYDCIFRTANKDFKCHKLILSAASEVFETMFYGSIPEKRQEIEILDITAEIFQIFINYIYMGDINFDELSLDETIELHYCAEKYWVSELIHNCLLAIGSKLRYDNILPALELSVCMDPRDLLEVCMSFFTRCCLSNAQYMAYHKCHYQHVSKDCIKAIIAANKASKQLLWFVYEWCQQECHELGLQQADCALIIDDLQLPVSANVDNMTAMAPAQLMQHQCSAVERTYYKACRPFTVDYEVHEWKMFVKCNRYMELHGIIMHSRLMPRAILGRTQAHEYCENLRIEITAPKQPTAGASTDSEGEDSEQALSVSNGEDEFIWQHAVSKQATKYNCDVNIDWTEALLLSPDVEYQIKLIWQSDAYGSEYPCSLQSNVVDGIEFRDSDAYMGSPIKGLRIVN